MYTGPGTPWLLALLFFLLFQFVWTGAGKIRSIYRQYRQFQEWRQNILPPNPFDGDGNREGIRDFIKRHFPRGASRAETEETARIFADAADRVESGELINEDDIFGYLAENLRPVCLSAGWPDFLDELWARAAQASIGSQPSAVAQALREAAEALKARTSKLLDPTRESLDPSTSPDVSSGSEAPASLGGLGSAANEALGPGETSAGVIANPGSGSRQRPYNYGGLYWW